VEGCAAELLGEIRDQESVSLLIAVLKASDERIKESACGLFCEIGGIEATKTY